MESDDDDERRPLIPSNQQKVDLYRKTFKAVLILDLITSMLMYIIYMLLNPIEKIDFESVIIPLDFLLLCLTRVVLLASFLRWRILVKLKTPVITTFGSILYLLIRSRFAYSVEAWFTLAFAFIFAWIEAGVYIHAIVVKGQGYWILEQNSDVDPSLDFVFPSSPAYAASSPTAITPYRGDDSSPTLDPVVMGSSAPISIVLPKNYNSTFSKSFAGGYQPQRLTEPQNHDCYRFLLKRHGELLKGIKSIIDGKLPEAEDLLKRQSRHEILPRFGLQLFQIQMLNACNHTVYTQLFTNLQSCRESAHFMLQIKDPKAITLALSDSITLALHKMYRGSMSSMGSFGDLSADISSLSMEQLFWKYWVLDVECCLGMSLLFQGLLQVLLGRVLKGAVNIGKAHLQFSKIGDALDQFSHFNLKQSPGLGIAGEAVYTLRSSVTESHSLATCCFYLLPSIAPHLQNAYLQNLKLKDDKWLALRTLYQITLKSSIDSFAASLFLLYGLSFPSPGFFALCYPAEQREIVNMLATIEFNIPIIQFLAFNVSRRLGVQEYTETRLKKVLDMGSSIGTIYWNAQFEKSILLLINMKSADALNLLHQIWNAGLERHTRGDVSSLDVAIGLFYASVLRLSKLEGDTMGIDLKVLHHLNHNLLPMLSKKYSQEKIHHSEETKLCRLVITWCIEQQSICKLLMFWLMYYRSDFTCLAGSKNNVPVLTTLAIRLHQEYESEKSLNVFGDTIYNLVLGTIFKYLTIHGIDSIKFFAAIFLGKKLVEVSKSLYNSGLESCKSLPISLKSLGIQYRILYELAELEALCFNNPNEAIILLNQCVGGSLSSDQLRLSVKSRSLSPNPTSISILPSFARKSQPKNQFQISSVNSEGALSTSSVSQTNFEWGSESKISEFGFAGADQMDLELETKCQVALDFLRQKRLSP